MAMTTKWFRAACGISLAALSAAAPAGDWPQWRGPRRDGVSTASDWAATWPASGPKVLWKASVGEGFSGPAVVGERVYTMGFFRDTSVKLPGVAQAPGLDHVWCLDARTGKPIWKHTYPATKGYYYGPMVSPTVDDGRLYTLSKYGRLLCLDAASGKVIWQASLVTDLKAKQPYYGYSSMPLVVGDVVIVHAGQPGPAMAAMDKKTGKVVWQAGKGPAGYASPVGCEFGGRPAVAMLMPRAAVGMEAATGKQLWSYPWKASPQSSATAPLVAGTKVFLSGSEKKRWCVLLDVAGGEAKVVWEHNEMTNYFNASVLWKGHLYGIHSTDHVSINSSLRCVDFETGKVKWDTGAGKGGVGKGAVTLAGGRLIVLCEKGELCIAEANPQRYVELARAKVLDGTCWTPPVLCRGRIYCRNHRGTLVCLDVSTK